MRACDILRKGGKEGPSKGHGRGDMIAAVNDVLLCHGSHSLFTIVSYVAATHTKWFNFTQVVHKVDQERGLN